MKWICTTKTEWGKTSKARRLWEPGEKVDSDVRPNKHFKSLDELRESPTKEKESLTADDMRTMTKGQINEKFKLGMDANALRVTRLPQVISRAAAVQEAERIRKNGNR